MNLGRIQSFVEEHGLVQNGQHPAFHPGVGVLPWYRPPRGFEAMVTPLRIDDHLLHQIDVALAWLDLSQLIKTPSYSSYGWKHICERDAGFYVCNVAMILAALDSGVVVKHESGSPNPWLGISRKELRPERRAWKRAILRSVFAEDTDAALRGTAS